ncbi:hypothetical protein E4U56_004472 [Claviceps arundinis]|uniref:Uncharacterized protein n=1 Tax=Claviceps arundinis TaxID=1623583 RepID=A0A9P7SL34_9HYPO|nr:hypothetical protein E4U56_004472 [Claviceps arundinis]
MAPSVARTVGFETGILICNAAPSRLNQTGHYFGAHGLQEDSPSSAMAILSHIVHLPTGHPQKSSTPQIQPPAA